MAILCRILGLVLVAAALLDVFHTLFHPAKAGVVSDWIARTLWRFLRSIFSSFLSLAGPPAFLTIVFYWAVSVIVGFALLYRPSVSAQNFTFANGLASDTLTSCGAARG